MTTLTSSEPMTDADMLQSAEPWPELWLVPVAPGRFFHMWNRIYAETQKNDDLNVSETLAKYINEAFQGIDPDTEEWPYLIDHPEQCIQLIWEAREQFCAGTGRKAVQKAKKKTTTLAPFQPWVAETVRRIVSELRSKVPDHQPKRNPVAGSNFNASNMSYSSGFSGLQSSAVRPQAFGSLNEDHMGRHRSLSANREFNNTPGGTATMGSLGPGTTLNRKTLLA